MQAAQALAIHMQKKYSDVFQDIGCSKNTVHIDIKDDAKPYQA